jgi:RDD family
MTAANGGEVPVAPTPVSSSARRFGALALELLLVAVTMFVGWFVWSLRTWARGQTPAKSLLSLRCVRVAGGRSAPWRIMVLREVVGKWLLGVLTLGIVPLVSAVMILRRGRMGVWDKLAKTQVVDDPDGLLVGPGVVQEPSSGPLTGGEGGDGGVSEDEDDSEDEGDSDDEGDSEGGDDEDDVESSVADGPLPDPDGEDGGADDDGGDESEGAEVEESSERSSGAAGS